MWCFRRVTTLMAQQPGQLPEAPVALGALVGPFSTVAVPVPPNPELFLKVLPQVGQRWVAVAVTSPGVAGCGWLRWWPSSCSWLGKARWHSVHFHSISTASRSSGGGDSWDGDNGDGNNGDAAWLCRCFCKQASETKALGQAGHLWDRVLEWVR